MNELIKFLLTAKRNNSDLWMRELVRKINMVCAEHGIMSSNFEYNIKSDCIQMEGIYKDESA
jgi:hypothetical protein